MKKKYVKPEMNVYRTNVESIMAASGQTSSTTMEGFQNTNDGTSVKGDSRDDNSIWDDDDQR